MSAKKFVQEFYKSDALIDAEIIKTYLHPEVSVDWNSSKGFIKMGFDELVAMAGELSRAYIRSKVRMTHIVQEGDTVAVRYSHYIKTIENPREDMLLAHFFAIWELKDGKLYRGYQMSQVG